MKIADDKRVAMVALALVLATVVALQCGCAAQEQEGTEEVQVQEVAEVASAPEPESASEPETESSTESEPESDADAVADSALEAYTWDELSQISAEIAAAEDEAAAIEVAKKYELCTADGKLDGTQTKSVTLSDGTETYVQIVGFAHDDKTSGGKAGITFIFGEILTEHSMGPTEYNGGGWEESYMRSLLADEGMAWLPEDLTAVVVPVDKLTNNVGQRASSVSSVSVTSDKLWLFSSTELFGEIDWFNDTSDAYQGEIMNAEGFEYELFRDMDVKSDAENPILVKDFVKGYSGDINTWWQRTPYDLDRFEFVAVDDAYESGGTSEEFRGVVPGFCI